MGTKGWVVDPNINQQLWTGWTYSPLGDFLQDMQEGGEDAADVDPADTSYASYPGDTQQDTGVVLEPQRNVTEKKRADKQRYLCGFLGEQCEFMRNKAGFKNCAKLK